MNRQRKHIAIVEDDDSIRELLAENLKRAGYQVSAFFSAEQFERKADAGFHLLLLDIMLPGKNGLALLKELRLSKQMLPVILLTASDQESHTDQAFSTGAIDYIVKPFNLNHLLLKIENLFEQLRNADTGNAQNDFQIVAGRFDPQLNIVVLYKNEHK